MIPAILRPYRPADRAGVHRIAADTAFFGDPVETFLEDRRLFNAAFTAYYTDYEPQHAWVACAGDEPVGYLLGCADTAAQHRRWSRQGLPGVARQALLGRYRLGSKTFRYSAGLLRAALEGETPSIDERDYPAHLHLNLDQAWRGQGLGRQLLERYLAQLQAEGIPGVHLRTTSYNLAACRLYEAVGFRLLGQRPTRAWTRHLPTPVENRCYGLKLDPSGMKCV